ncbi:MAG: hypothetical protein KKE76_03415 [Gammaproteobacteria bacterium]|nr:hypothetical protein [Gammaproteobacteria bacterium]
MNRVRCSCQNYQECKKALLNRKGAEAQRKANNELVGLHLFVIPAHAGIQCLERHGFRHAPE